MSDLVDIYKRELNSDLLALRNIGKRISGKKRIEIIFSKHDDGAFTDGRRIFIPNFCEGEIQSAQGFVAHESGHIGYGSFEIGFFRLIDKLAKKYDVPLFFLKHLVNVLEDVRINELNKREFPGFYKNLRDYTLKMLPKIKEKMNFFENIFIYLNLFMEHYPEFQKKPKFHKFPISDEDWEIICIIKDFLLKTLTPNATIIAADQLCKLLIKYFTFNKREKKPEKYGNENEQEKKYFDRGIYAGREANSRANKIIFLPTLYEEFHDDEIEEKNTHINQSSNKMIDKIEDINLTANDLKELTRQVDIKNEKKGKKKEQHVINKKIEDKLKKAYNKTNKSKKKMETALKNLEMIYTTENNRQTGKEEKKVVKILKNHIKDRKNNFQKHIYGLERDVSDLKSIIDDFEDLQSEKDEIARNKKREQLLTKVKNYQKKSNQQDLVKNNKKNKALDVLLRDLENPKNISTNKEKNLDTIKSLKKRYHRQTKIIKQKKKDFKADLYELNDIIKTIEKKNKAAKPNNKSQKIIEILNKLRRYKEKTKIRNEAKRKGRVKENPNFKVITDLLQDLNDVGYKLNERIKKIGEGSLCLTPPSLETPRKVVVKRIENDEMDPIPLTYATIKAEYSLIMKKMKLLFSELRKNTDWDNYQKRGRLNKNFIKTLTSSYTYQKCFTRKIQKNTLKILLLVDISGSMRGKKLESAKISMIIFTEALKDLADIRIVLFTGEYDARNIIVKDFGEALVSKRLDMVGCHYHIASNLDGLTMEHEASKLTGKEIIIVISDGQPAGRRGYGLRMAMNQIHKVRKQFKVFAFSIDAKGDYLDQLYGKSNWILANSSDKRDLAKKIMQFSRLLIKEFY